MNNEFLAMLKEDLKTAEKRFAEAKEDCVKRIETMNTYDCVAYGAAYASHIDQVTIWGNEVYRLTKLISNYERMNG